jgi:alkylation response protein AidB-like acyl-CoA dehydrogenase
MTTNQSGAGRPNLSEHPAGDQAWRSISESVRALECHLGDPRRPEVAFSFAQALQHDEREDYPLAAQSSIDTWDLAEFLIPVDLGGRLRTTEELLALVRVVARRDLTVAISFGANLLAALPVWIAGTSSQRQAVAEILRSRRGLALALTERGHGSDLLANGFRADPVDEGFRLSGEKWLILNAQRSATMVVFARTRPSGGPRCFSLFLLEKGRLDPTRWEPLPREPTLGLRGADVSGIRFRSCLVPGDTMVGPPGRAYETVQLTLAVTRTLCAALALGAADTALRIAVGFALRRRLYGQAVFDVPHARSLLVGAFLDCLACDCVTYAAIRAMQRPGEPVAFWSALVKYYLPTVIERAVHDLSVVLGARFYLRSEQPCGMFQKMLRDLAIVSVFEGSTVVNLGILSSQLARRPTSRAGPSREEERIHELYDLGRSQMPFSPRSLRLRPLTTDPVVTGLPTAEALEFHLRDCCPQTSFETRKAILEDVLRLRERVSCWERAFEPARHRFDSRPHAMTPELSAHVERYCRLHAAAACFHIWSRNGSSCGGFLGRGDWLVLRLKRLLADDRGAIGEATPWIAAVAEELVDRFYSDRLYSIIPHQLATRSAPENGVSHAVSDEPSHQTALKHRMPTSDQLTIL